MSSAAAFPVREMREEPAPPAQIYLQPVAPPSILGLYGFAGATFMVAAHMALWYGNAMTDLYLAPMAALFGGVAQFSAGMWSFKARDGLATGMHGTWGSFWIAFGLLQLAFLHGTLAKPSGAFPALGYWFIVLAAITWAGTWAAAAENRALTLVLGFLAAGSTAAAAANLTGNAAVSVLAGYLFIVSAIIAWYTATALMLEGTFKRPVLAVGKTQKARQQPTLAPGRGAGRDSGTIDLSLGLGRCTAWHAVACTTRVAMADGEAAQSGKEGEATGDTGLFVARVLPMKPASTFLPG